MLVNFYLNKRFFPRDITLIASVVGESVISCLTMVLAGSLSQLKWHDSLKLVAGVSDDRSLSPDLTATQID
jgi:hypothetical protein